MVKKTDPGPSVIRTSRTSKKKDLGFSSDQSTTSIPLVTFLFYYNIYWKTVITFRFYSPRKVFFFSERVLVFGPSFFSSTCTYYDIRIQCDVSEPFIFLLKNQVVLKKFQTTLRGILLQLERRCRMLLTTK